MIDLKEQITQSADQLEEVYTLVGSVPADVSLLTECYEYWSEKSNLHHTLRTTAVLLDVRDRATEVAKRLIDPDRIKNEEERVKQSGSPANTFLYDGVLMDFSVARHLAVTSYIATTWSIYDRLTNVCGRLAAVAEIANNPKQNPKMCENFLNDKKNFFGFSMQFHLKKAYSWPLKVSYRFRNWLVHDGYEANGVPVFRGERISDGLYLHAEAMESLSKSEYLCNDKDFCCLKQDENFPWYDESLLTILDKYHKEADIMFTGLLDWSVSSFVGQVKSFSERDRDALAAAFAGERCCINTKVKEADIHG